MRIARTRNKRIAGHVADFAADKIYRIENMEPQLEKIREVQKEAWNKSSVGWKKWDDVFMEFLKPMLEEMIKMLHLKDDGLVLDVATGTGEPGLTIASILKNGKVVMLILTNLFKKLSCQQMHVIKY